jgi:hypothetical protein
VKLTVPPGAGRWVRRRQAGLAVTGLVVAAAVARILVVRGMKAPVVVCDEFIYSNIAKNLAEHGRYLFRGVPSHQSYVYPLLIAPAWFFHSMATTYALAKAIGAVAMSLVAVPTYLWTRSLAGAWYGVLAAGLTLLLPAFFYSGILMSEATFLPAFVLACFAIASMLERPTLVHQLAALAALALAVAIRVQGIVLVPVIPTAVLFKVVLDWRAGLTSDRVLAELRRLWLTAVLLVGGAALYVAYKQVQGEPLVTGLGTYQVLGRTHYPVVPTARWAVRHLAELEIALGLVPVAALIVLLWLGLVKNAATNAERCLLAVVSAAMLWMLAEVGAFSAAVTPFVFERYTYYLEPLLLIAFVVWLARGLPRPMIGTALAVVVPVALLFALDLDRFVVPDAVNGVTLASLSRFSRHLPGAIGELRLFILIGAALSVFLFALCSRAVARVALPALLAAYLVAVSLPAQDRVLAVSRDSRSAAGGEASWVSQAVGRDSPAVYVLTPSKSVAPSTVLLQTEFWNPNVVDVYSVGATEVCGIYETPTTIQVATGRVEPPVPDQVDYAIADRSLPFAGRRVAVGGPADEPLALYRVGRSLRVGEITEGIYGDGWMGENASYTRYVAPRRAPGRLTVTVGRQAWGGQDVPGHVVISVGRPAAGGPGLEQVLATRSWIVHRLEQRSFTFETPPPPIRAVVHVEPTFSPSQFGQADTRQLGAQVSFTPG